MKRLLFSAALVVFLTTANAFNISRILDQYPQFSQFNSLLTQSGLVPAINSRRTITVLAVNDESIGDLAGRPLDVQKRILSNHVVLDYFDLLKLNKLKNEKTMITTLYQASGTADDQQGFLVVVHKPDGSIVFGSAMENAPVDAKLQASVLTQPYNISVLSISHVIVAPGIDGTLPPAATPPPPPAPKAAAPAVVADPPAETPVEEEPTADAPAAEADAPSAEAPVAADAPVADAPVSDKPVDDAPADTKSGAVKQAGYGLGLGMVAALVSLVVA